MEYYYIIIGCCVVVFIIFFIIRAQYKKKYELKVNEIAHNEAEKIKNTTIIECKATLDELAELKSKLQDANSQVLLKQSTLTSLNKMIEEKSSFNTNLLKIREEELNKVIEKEREKRLTLLDKEIQDWAESAQEAAMYERDSILQSYQSECDKGYEELRNIWAEINEYKAQRDAINQEILRSRALNEKQDFYRIQLKEEDKEDINYLLSIVARFNNKETIYKLIWTEYLQKPFKLMLNRVLGGKDPKNVIYMIKNLNTQEIYIGKTKGDVSKRWTEHIKTSLNIGTISRSNIHKALFNHWDEYSFSIVEEVKNEDKLSERERYYINFYESNIYGYNIKSGG